MVYSNVIDLPISIRKVRWVVANEVRARVQAVWGVVGEILRTVWISVLVRFTGPGSAKVGIDDDTHVVEVFVNRTIALRIDGWFTKLRDVWSSIRDARGNTASWEEPCLDVVGCPFGSIHTTTDVVQRVSVIVGGECIVHL